MVGVVFILVGVLIIMILSVIFWVVFYIYVVEGEMLFNFDLCLICNVF